MGSETESSASTWVNVARQASRVAAERQREQAVARQLAERAAAAKAAATSADRAMTENRARRRSDVAFVPGPPAHVRTGVEVPQGEAVRRGRLEQYDSAEEGRAVRATRGDPWKAVTSGVDVSPPTADRWERKVVAELDCTDKLGLLGMLVRYQASGLSETRRKRSGWTKKTATYASCFCEARVVGWSQRDGSKIGEAPRQPVDAQGQPDPENLDLLKVELVLQAEGRSARHTGELAHRFVDIDLRELEHLYVDTLEPPWEWPIARELTGVDRAVSGREFQARPAVVPEEVHIATPRENTMQARPVASCLPAPPPWAGPAWGLLRNLVSGGSGDSGPAADDEEEEDVFKSLDVSFVETTPSNVTETDSPLPVEVEGAGKSPDVLCEEVGIEVAAANELLTRQPVLQVLYNPKILPHLLEIIRAAKYSVCALQYQCEEHHIVAALVDVVRREAEPVAVRLVLDKKMMANPSAKGQPNQVGALIEHGVEVRVRHPKPARLFSAQHEKSVLIDDALAVVGSANWTHNSMENCEESVISTRARNVVQAARQHFEDMWSVAEPYTCAQAWAVSRDIDDRKALAARGRATSTPPCSSTQRRASRAGSHGSLDPVPETEVAGPLIVSDSGFPGSGEGAGTRKGTRGRSASSSTS